MHSSKYIQCAKLLSYPKKAEIICNSLSEKIKNKFSNIDIIMSPAIGGIVVGYEIGRQLGIETIFSERVGGVLTLRRGFKISKNMNVLIVEDVITTGKSALECSELIKKSKANTLGYSCIIDRSNKNSDLKEDIISQIKLEIDTFEDNNLPDELKKIQPIKPGSRNLI